jgi:hypothetical protein
MSDRSTSELPGPRGLTRALLEPFGTRASEDRSSVFDAAREIPRTLADLAVPRPGGGSFRLTDHHVRAALAPAGAATPGTPGTSGTSGTSDTPFAWSARTARRALGLAGLRALVAGTARTPIDGVTMAIDGAVHAVRQGDNAASPMDRWLAGLSAAGRAAVLASAVTWATRVWCALDWNAFGESPTIGRDHWWDSPHSSLLALRSRAEVRSVARDQAGSPRSVHLVVLGGPRRATIRSELSVAAMVEVLCSPRSLPPGRMVGWWPDSGHLVTLEIDQLALHDGVAAVARTLASAGASPADFGGVIRAAA